MFTDEDRTGAVLVVHVNTKRLDAARAPAFKEHVQKRIDDGARRIVIDLTKVEFVDSSGLGALVSCLKRLGPTGSVAIAGASAPVKKLFSITRMDKVFTMDDSVTGAVVQLST